MSTTLGLLKRLVPAAAFLAVAAATAQQALDLDVPYVPTPTEVVDRMLSIARVGKDDYLIDLGSGDGRIAIAAARRGARALGVDIDPRRVTEAIENAVHAGVSDRVTFRVQDLFDTPIRDATVITMYLLPTINLQVRPRLLAELRPGSRVVSHSFSMGGWRPDGHESVERRDVYFWVIPANVAGDWQVTDGNRVVGLTLKQEFQEVTGTATFEGRSSPLRDVGLSGQLLNFSVDLGGGQSAVYRGRVSGDRMEARADAGRAWSAVRTVRPAPPAAQKK